MLSATAGALDEALVGEVDPVANPAEADSSDCISGLPSGVSLMVCPVLIQCEGYLAEISPTSVDDGGDFVEQVDPSIDPSIWKVVGCWTGIEICTLPPATSEPSEDGGSGDWVDPVVDPVVDSVVDPGSGDGSDGGVDPVVIVDPIECFPPAPVDVRVEFVSSDSGYACYYYLVGADGAVENVTVVASYDEPSIVAFIADHSDDGSFSIEDTGSFWVIHDFPLDLAPPVPETGGFCPIPDTSDPTEVTGVDPLPDDGDTGISGESDGATDSNSDPTLDAYLEFVSENPAWPDEHGAGGIQLQVITASDHLPWLEFGTPGQARAFDAWYGQTLRHVAIADGGDPLVSDPIVFVCDGPRRFCDGPPLIVSMCDAVSPADLPSRPTPSAALVPAPAASSIARSPELMAAFAASAHVASGEPTVPFGSGRRRR